MNRHDCVPASMLPIRGGASSSRRPIFSFEKRRPKTFFLSFRSGLTMRQQQQERHPQQQPHGHVSRHSLGLLPSAIARSRRSRGQPRSGCRGGQLGGAVGRRRRCGSVPLARGVGLGEGLCLLELVADVRPNIFTFAVVGAELRLKSTSTRLVLVLVLVRVLVLVLVLEGVLERN